MHANAEAEGRERMAKRRKRRAAKNTKRYEKEGEPDASVSGFRAEGDHLAALVIPPPGPHGVSANESRVKAALRAKDVDMSAPETPRARRSPTDGDDGG